MTKVTNGKLEMKNINAIMVLIKRKGKNIMKKLILKTTVLSILSVLSLGAFAENNGYPE